MAVIQLYKKHGVATVRTLEGIVAKRMENGLAPAVKGKKDTVLLFWDSPAELFIGKSVTCINAVITDHLEMFFRDMLGQAGDEIKDGDSFRDKPVIFMPVIVESNKRAVIGVDT